MEGLLTHHLQSPSGHRNVQHEQCHVCGCARPGAEWPHRGLRLSILSTAFVLQIYLIVRSLGTVWFSWADAGRFGHATRAYSAYTPGRCSGREMMIFWKRFLPQIVVGPHYAARGRALDRSGRSASGAQERWEPAGAGLGVETNRLGQQGSGAWPTKWKHEKQKELLKLKNCMSH